MRSPIGQRTIPIQRLHIKGCKGSIKVSSWRELLAYLLLTRLAILGFTKLEFLCVGRPFTATLTDDQMPCNPLVQNTFRRFSRQNCLRYTYEETTTHAEGLFVTAGEAIVKAWFEEPAKSVLATRPKHEVCRRLFGKRIG